RLRLLAVEVAVPVEQVRLEQAVRLGFVELRSPPERDRRGVDLARWALVPAGVDAVGREEDVVRNGDVRGGKAELVPAEVAALDDAAHLVRSAEHAIGRRQVT